MTMRFSRRVMLIHRRSRLISGFGRVHFHLFAPMWPADDAREAISSDVGDVYLPQIFREPSREGRHAAFILIHALELSALSTLLIFCLAQRVSRRIESFYSFFSRSIFSRLLDAAGGFY